MAETRGLELTEKEAEMVRSALYVLRPGSPKALAMRNALIDRVSSYMAVNFPRDPRLRLRVRNMDNRGTRLAGEG